MFQLYAVDRAIYYLYITNNVQNIYFPLVHFLFGPQVLSYY